MYPDRRERTMSESTGRSKFRLGVFFLLLAAVAVVRPALAGNMTYAYDAVGRVTKVVYADGGCVTYAYDPAGNRTQNGTLAVIANPDAFSTPQNTAATVDPRANDLSCVALTITAVGAPSHGTAIINGGASVTYTPTGGYFGADAFPYTVSSGGSTATNTVNFTVVPPTETATIGAGAVATGAASGHTFGTNSVTITGGSGSYTYAWSNTNDGFGTWATGGAASTFTPSVSGVTPTTSCVSAAHYKVTVTDTVTHVVFASNVANYKWTNTSPSCLQ